MQEEQLFSGKSGHPGQEEEPGQLMLAGATPGSAAQAPLFPHASTAGSLAPQHLGLSHYSGASRQGSLQAPGQMDTGKQGKG